MERRPILLFDVMDTLVHEPFFQEIPAFFGLSQAELMAAKHPSALVEFELGRTSEGEFLARFFRDGRAFDHAGFVRTVRAASSSISAASASPSSRQASPMRTRTRAPSYGASICCQIIHAWRSAERAAFASPSASRTAPRA